MQPQISEKSNLLQSRRFLAHQPTFNSAPPVQGFNGLQPKQGDGETFGTVQPPLLVRMPGVCTFI